MSWWVAGSMIVGAIGSGIGTDRSINRQREQLLEKERALRKQAIQTRNAYETRFIQTENMHSDKLEALEKTKIFNTNKVLAMGGGSGASVGEGTTAHVVASENARGEFALNSYRKKSDFELENIREKGENEQARFNSMADEADDAYQYLTDNGKQMVFESMLTGGMGATGSGVAMKSAWT